MSFEIQNWHKAFDSKMRVFPTVELQGAIEFLRKARTRSEGWGAFPGVESDLHCSALAIEALRICPNHQSLSIIVDAVAFLRREFGHTPETMTLSQIGDMLSIVYSESNPDEEYALKLIGALPKAYDEKVASRGEPAVREVSSILLVLLKINKSNHPSFRVWTERLLKMQNQEDGSWGTAAGEAGSLVSTASALSVLSRLKDDRIKNPRNRGLKYLLLQVEKQGWEKLGSGGDTFTQATTLQCFGESTDVRYKEIQDGVTALLRRINLNDGGWGGGVGEPSNVECTCLCIIALAASGENKFVPMRLAGEVVSEIEHQMKEAASERNQLRQDQEKQIEQRIASVLRERDNLRDEVKKLRGESQEKTKSLEAQIFNMQKTFALERESLEQWVKHRAYPALRTIQTDLLMGGFGIFTGVFSTWAMIHYWEWPLPFSRILLLVCSLIIPIWFLMVLIRWIRSQTSARERYSDESIRARLLSRDIERERLAPWSDNLKDYTGRETFETRMVSEELREVLLEVPQSLREELLYRLLRDVIDLPPDIGSRFVNDLVAKYDLPNQHRRRLIQIFDLFLRLGSQQRRLVVEQLRHTFLR